MLFLWLFNIMMVWSIYFSILDEIIVTIDYVTKCCKIVTKNTYSFLTFASWLVYNDNYSYSYYLNVKMIGFLSLKFYKIK